ncbi:YebC/PmpR family DNA-binding transcriptional regulator [bacterium]|jgi:YebC/PmpR family DNA-binding regulatory protein|nr:YebC/PmpR family DNA-binding transcriptional regulator [bacterium]
MSGHSKWATIKRKKGALDAARGQVFTKLIREITISAKMGGGEIEGNARLRAAVLSAKAANMPGENIKRAIQKGTGELPGVSYDEVVYEGYGPYGVAVIVEGSTDNKNRTVAEVRHAFNKRGGNLGESGCVGWMFDTKGVILVEKGNFSEDDLMMTALEAGAEDVITEDEGFTIKTEPADFEKVREAVEKLGVSIVSAEISKVPNNFVKITEEQEENLNKLLETLDELDDVSKLHTNHTVES